MLAVSFVRLSIPFFLKNMTQEVLQEAIQSSLLLMDVTSAKIIAEILVTTSPSVQNTHLFAKTLYLSGELNHALATLDPTCSHFPSLFLYGICCYDLKNYIEGEAAVRKCVTIESSSPQELSAAWCLLGKHF